MCICIYIYIVCIYIYIYIYICTNNHPKIVGFVWMFTDPHLNSTPGGRQASQVSPGDTIDAIGEGNLDHVEKMAGGEAGICC